MNIFAKRKHLGRMLTILSVFFILCLFTSANLLFASETSSPATEASPVTTYAPVKGIPVPDTDSALAVYLYCFNNEKVLYEKNKDAQIYPGSSAKMMTALLTLENCNDFNEIITITDELAKGMGSSGIIISVGTNVSIQDLFDGMVCSGANNASVVLANYISGSTDAFAEKMNKRANELGMENTHYMNPTGNDAQGAVTTVSDIAKLAKVLYNKGKFMEAASSPSCTLESLGEKVRVYNRNYFRTTWYTSKYYYTAVNGMNAGNTKASGFSVTATAEIDGCTYLCIVTGAPENTETKETYSYKIARELLDYASRNFEYREVVSCARIFCELPVKYGNETDYITVIPERASIVYLPKNADYNKLSIDWGVFEDYLSAPIEENTQIGTLSVYYDGELLDTLDLVTSTSIAKNKTSYFISLTETVFKSVLFWEIFAAIVILVIIITVYKLYKKHGAQFFVIGGDSDDDDNDEDEKPKPKKRKKEPKSNINKRTDK